MSASVRITETCACGASIEAVGGSLYRHDEHRANPRSPEEVVERWRTDHHHAQFDEAQTRLQRVRDLADDAERMFAQLSGTAMATEIRRALNGEDA